MSKVSAVTKGLILALGAGAFTANVHAVSPKKLELGEGLTATPTLGVDVRYDDNIYQTGENQESSWVTSISPGVMFEAIHGRSVYQLGYSFNSDFYDVSGQDGNTDHHLNGAASFGFNRSNRLALNASYDRVENVGNTAVIGVSDQFETTRLEAIYGLGAPSGAMNVDLGVNQELFRSLNSGSANAEREYDKPGATATLYYRLSPKTRALVEYGYDSYEYVQSTSELDSKQDAYSLGLTWTATAQTVGTVKIGQQQRDFDDDRLDDTDEASWTADITWEPSPRDTVLLFTTKGIEDGNVELTENAVNAARYGVEWSHQLDPRMYTTLSYNYGDEEYLGASGREDDVMTYGASISFDLRRWMTLGLGYRYLDRDSNIGARTYDQNVFMLNMDFSL
jgi:polysaccharide biosynthesis protein VpsM